MYRRSNPASTANLSDHELIALVVRCDEAALAALYDRFGGLVYSIALRITGDRAVAEEVVQDAFHAVWRTAGGFQPTGSVTAWMIGIARHRAIDATRGRTFRARVREHNLDNALTTISGEATEEQVEQRLVGEQVRAALGQLHPTQREALELAYYGGLSQSEIAARLGAPLGTIKTRLRLGLLHLRQQLAPALWAT